MYLERKKELDSARSHAVKSSGGGGGGASGYGAGYFPGVPTYKTRVCALEASVLMLWCRLAVVAKWKRISEKKEKKKRTKGANARQQRLEKYDKIYFFGALALCICREMSICVFYLT